MLQPALSIFTTAAFVTTLANAQVTEIDDSVRYFDLSTNGLNEPCLSYDNIPYRVLFQLDDRGNNGIFWRIADGQELAQRTDDCIELRKSFLTVDPGIDFISYDLRNLIIADENGDTGLRYDVASRADSMRFDLGFSFDFIAERRVGETIVLTGAGSVSFAGPTSFPDGLEASDHRHLTTDFSFNGTVNYDADANRFTIAFDSDNDAGNYTLTITFQNPDSQNEIGLIMIYPVEFHVI